MKDLKSRVERAAEASLAEEDMVSAVDVFLRLGWLPASILNEWKQGRFPTLEGALQPRPALLGQALELLSEWAMNKGLTSTEGASVARTPGREPLRFSVSGDPAREALYRLHFVSSALTQKQRERLEKKAKAVPELVVIQAQDPDWKCHRCGRTGELLIMEPPGPSCLACAGLGELEYLPAGDAGLSRRAKAGSKKFAVVVRFSRSRGRYERQGLLVEPEALRLARGRG